MPAFVGRMRALLSSAAVSGGGSGGAGGGSFTPADLLNLLAWYKADAGTFSDAGVTPATNGQTVARWNDNGPHGYHLSASGAGGLILRTNTLNGLATLENDGTLGLGTSGTPIALGGSALSAFIVVKWTATIGAKRIISVGPAGNDVGTGGFTVFENNSLTDVETYQNGVKAVATAPASAWMQLGTIFDDVAHTNTMYVNNVAGTPVAATVTFDALTDIGITTTAGSGAEPITGSVAEVVITKSALTLSESSSLYAYFTSRWFSVAAGALLLETGSDLLLETGSRLLLG